MLFEQLINTLYGKLFLHFDNGIYGANRIILFTSEKLIIRLKHYKCWFGR